MDWVCDHYTRQSELVGRPAISDQHRQIAERLHAWSRQLPECRRVLELGAGACGVAAAMTELGHEVHAVEFNPADIVLARQLVEHHGIRGLHIVDADFYSVVLDGRFDLVYYWDGFGVGDDAEQRRLLRRIGTEWLTDGGIAIIDVFSPWNWQRRSGEIRPFTAKDGTTWTREVRFDALHGRLRDFLRPDDGRDIVLSQTIRTYTLQEFMLLVERTGTRVQAFYAMDGSLIDLEREDAEVSEGLSNTNGYIAQLGRE